MSFEFSDQDRLGAVPSSPKATPMISTSPPVANRGHGTPVHPGEILAEELAARGVSANRLAHELDVPGIWLREIIDGRRAITADTALRLAAGLGTSARFWMTLQNRYDLAATGRGEVT